MQMKVKDNILTLTCDISAPGTISKGGKMILVDSTGGFVAVPGTDLRVSLNLGRKV